MPYYLVCQWCWYWCLSNQYMLPLTRKRRNNSPAHESMLVKYNADFVYSTNSSNLAPKLFKYIVSADYTMCHCVWISRLNWSFTCIVIPLSLSRSIKSIVAPTLSLPRTWSGKIKRNNYGMTYAVPSYSCMQEH